MSDEAFPLSTAALARLQAVIDRSNETAAPGVRETFGYPERHMTATEFVTFWNSVRLVAVSTVGTQAQPHIAPVHARFDNDHLVMWIYENATRRKDLQRNPRIALTAWGEDRSVAIAYGRAREITAERRETRPGSSGKPRFILPVRIELTRVHAMKPPPA